MSVMSALFACILLFPPALIESGRDIRGAFTEWQAVKFVATKPETYLLVAGKFRVIYETAGINAVPLKDANENDVPDYVEDVSKQIWAANQFYDRLGFRSPFNSRAYHHIKTVDVFIVHPSKMRNMLGLTILIPTYAFERPKNERAIRMYISTTLNLTKNATVTHEYFHLIQTGMTAIRNDWYLEGLARWSESSLGSIRIAVEEDWKLEDLLASPLALNYVVTSSYNSAKVFWAPIAYYHESPAKLFFMTNDPLLSLTLSDGSPVLQDNIFHGVELMRLFLNNLEKVEAQIIKEHKLRNLSGRNAKHPRNNTYIFQALWDAHDQYKKQSILDPRHLLFVVEKRINPIIQSIKDAYANHSADGNHDGDLIQDGSVRESASKDLPREHTGQ